MKLLPGLGGIVPSPWVTPSLPAKGSFPFVTSHAAIASCRPDLVSLTLPHFFLHSCLAFSTQHPLSRPSSRSRLPKVSVSLDIIFGLCGGSFYSCFSKAFSSNPTNLHHLDQRNNGTHTAKSYAASCIAFGQTQYVGFNQGGRSYPLYPGYRAEEGRNSRSGGEGYQETCSTSRRTNGNSIPIAIIPHEANDLIVAHPENCTASTRHAFSDTAEGRWS